MDAVMIRHAAQAEQLGAYDSLIILKARKRNTSADVVCIAQRYRVGRKVRWISEETVENKPLKSRVVVSATCRKKKPTLSLTGEIYRSQTHRNRKWGGGWQGCEKRESG